MLLATDFVDVDPTLLAVCSFENDPIGLTGAAVGVAPAKVVLVSVVEGVFSPKSQYVVTLPLPCVKKIQAWILAGIQMIHAQVHEIWFYENLIIISNWSRHFLYYSKLLLNHRKTFCTTQRSLGFFFFFFTAVVILYSARI